MTGKEAKAMKYCIPFEEIRKEDVAIAGGKGANLGEMTAAGIPVPKGAVLTAAAYEKYMEENQISPDAYESAKELREAICRGKLPLELEKELEAYYEALGGQARLAIRSSATAEDLEDASFAGQQETYLNVVGLQAIYQKVKDCYASLWGDRAISYRKNAGYDQQRVALAVVLQEMIESESAGVMFTSDPSGDPGNVHVNASYGLGEAVVSGIVSPDEYVCDREGNVLKSVIGSKEYQIVYGENGTEKVAVDDAARKTQVLSEDVIHALVAEGMKIEKHYGHPMDIEWAVRDDRIYILQARAITTLSRQEEKIFTEADFAKYPKVEPAKGRMRENVLFNLEKTPTPYYPLDHDFGGLVGEQKGVLFKEIGIQFGDSMYPIDQDGVNFLTQSKPSITRRVFQIPHYLKKINDMDENVRKADASLKQCRASFDKEKQADPKTAQEIGSSLKRMRELIGKTAYDRFLYALFPNAIESMRVNKELKKWGENWNSYDLLEGLSYVTADLNREMAQIAAWIRADERRKDCVLNRDYEEICAEYPELSERFTAFLERYGAKSDFNCYCYISKSWREEPDRFLKVLRPMVKKSESKVPTMEEGLENYRAILNKARSSLSAKKYTAFEKRAEALRHYHYIREATQYLWESEFEYCRMLLHKLEKLTDHSYEDYLYLFADEFFTVCEHGWTEKEQGLVEKRRRMRPLAVAYWQKAMQDALENGEDGITGIGGSAGQASGRVCIVRSPKEFDKLCEGDILVCTYTDPEWTPLFCLAAGVVVDTGGTLSHAAIVAREYQIPAVLATGDATKKLKNGDFVMVDGTSGKVILTK